MIFFPSYNSVPPCLVRYRNLSGIMWELERYLKPLKPSFSVGMPMWHYFHGVFFAEFSLHLGKIMGTERVK